MKDCRNAGNLRMGENKPSAILNNEKVKKIKEALKLGAKIKDLAFQYNVGKSTIQGIKSGRIWKHITI